MKAMILGVAGPHLREALKQEEVEFEAFDTSQLLLYVSESINGYDRVYDQDTDDDKPKRLKVKEYDFIIPRLSGNLEIRTVILEHLNGNLGIFSPQKAEALRTASNKILTILKLSQQGIKTPKTVWAKAPVHIDHIVNEMLGGLPVILKTVHGSQGVGVAILETKNTTNTVLESFYKNEINVKLQRFIDGSFKDIRAIVVGDKVVVAMERTANKGDFRANLSKNGSGKRTALSQDEEKMCVDAAKAVGLSFAGIDLMRDQDGVSYCIEANGNPGSKIIDITGYNYFIDLVQYCKRKGKDAPEPKKEEPNDSNTPGTQPANPQSSSCLGEFLRKQREKAHAAAAVGTSKFWSDEDAEELATLKRKSGLIK